MTQLPSSDQPFRRSVPFRKSRYRNLEGQLRADGARFETGSRGRPLGRPVVHRALAALLVVALATGPVFAQAETGSGEGATTSGEATTADQAAREEAGQRFQRGLAFYGDGEYSLALIEFDRAYQLVPDYRVLYNIGQVSIQLSRFARARLALEQYLSEGGAAIPADRAEQVKRDLGMLMDRTAYLEVTSSPEGAEIIVDERSFGETPLAQPLLLDAGEHQVVLKKKGFQTVTRRIVLAGAERLPLAVDMVAEQEQVVIVQKPEPQPTNAPPPEDAGASKGPDAAVYAWIGTGVLATAAVTMGVLGLDAKGRYDQEMNQPDPDEDVVDAAAADTKTFFLAFDILAVATAAGLGASLYLTLHKPKPKRSVSGRGAPPPQGSLGVVVLPSSLRLQGTF